MSRPRKVRPYVYLVLFCYICQGLVCNFVEYFDGSQLHKNVMGYFTEVGRLQIINCFFFLIYFVLNERKRRKTLETLTAKGFIAFLEDGH